LHRWRRDSRADRSEFLLVPDPDQDAAFDLQRLEKWSQGVSVPGALRTMLIA
jgi:hypothetical protein